VLAFDYAPGGPADFAPGSRDLPAVVDTLNRLFKGTELVHSDINPSNFLVQGGSAVLVDWGYPTVGAVVWWSVGVTDRDRGRVLPDMGMSAEPTR
jgi:hypothetical protein